MSKNYRLGLRLMFWVSLLSLFLQSCSVDADSPVPNIKEQTDSIQESTNQIIINQPVDKEFVAKEDHRTISYEKDERLQLNIGDNSPMSFNRMDEVLPVYTAEDMSVMETASLGEKEQMEVTQIHLPESSQLGHVGPDKNELLGNMKKRRKVKGEKEREKEKERDDKCHEEVVMSWGNFQIFPTELLQKIFTSVSSPHILNCMGINHTFYEFITGNRRTIDLIGLKHKLQTRINVECWTIPKTVDFTDRKLATLTPETMNSYIFYQLMIEVKSLPQPFWSYLKDTNIHTLNLSNNNIGDEDMTRLALDLEGTNIETLDLSNNQIGDAGATTLAQHLQRTNIRVLNLGCNSIGVKGIDLLLQHLDDTNINTLILLGNQIGLEVKLLLASYRLQGGTKAHTIDLMVDNGGFFKHSLNTTIHTLNLNSWNID
ncbi:MAG: hypothetical protein BGO68_01670 [Candidatus Amoebophilus sp. 36-38]|nr:MAG: hypothetical protein BGO68_01670 [Candidatus Amoebophilus sp. 36-38]